MGNFCQFSKLEEVRVKKLRKTHAIHPVVIGQNSSGNTLTTKRFG